MSTLLREILDAITEAKVKGYTPTAIEINACDIEGLVEFACTYATRGAGPNMLLGLIVTKRPRFTITAHRTETAELPSRK